MSSSLTKISFITNCNISKIINKTNNEIINNNICQWNTSLVFNAYEELYNQFIKSLFDKGIILENHLQSITYGGYNGINRIKSYKTRSKKQ